MINPNFSSFYLLICSVENAPTNRKEDSNDEKQNDSKNRTSFPSLVQFFEDVSEL
jgi:hypothetical protein